MHQPHRLRAVPRLHPSRLLAVAALAVGLLGALAGPASAHAIVERTRPGSDEVVPTSPPDVVMRFNEPVEIAFGAIRVFDTDGRRVDDGPTDHLPGDPAAIRVPLTPDLPEGTYTVTWRVVSADGHPIEEAFVFHVGRPGENPRGIADRLLRTGTRAGPLESAVGLIGRLLEFAGIVVLVGAVVFRTFVWRRAASAAEPATNQAFETRWRRLAGLSWWGLLVGSVLVYVGQAAAAADLPLLEAVRPGVLAELATTRTGAAGLVRLDLILALGALWRLGADRVGARPWVGTAAWTCLGGLLLTPGLSGHAGTTPPVWLNLPADVLHVAAASAWIGGLLLLLAAGLPSVRRDREGPRLTAAVVSRFSDLALWSVVIVLVTGTFRSWIEVRALRALTGAPYGWVLLSKVAAFGLVVAVGAVNNRRTKPAIARAAAAGSEDGSVQRLRRLVRWEVAGATAVLVLTAFLVNLPPARVEAGVEGPFTARIQLGDVGHVDVVVDPNLVGENEVHLTLVGHDGLPVDAEEMRVRFRMPEAGIGPLVGQGTRLGVGHFVVQGRQLSVSGEWELEIVIRLGDFDEERARVTVNVNG